MNRQWNIERNYMGRWIVSTDGIKNLKFLESRAKFPNLGIRDRERSRGSQQQ